MKKINVHDVLAGFSEAWSPRIIGSMNDAELKVARLSGDFVWHHHDDTDEVFFVIDGSLTMRFRDGGVEDAIQLAPGDLLAVPAGTEHCPCAPGGCSVMLFERRGTLNTGNAGGALTNEGTHL